MKNLYYKGILTENRRLCRFPIDRLKRVEQPTTRITDDVKRFDARETITLRISRGDFGVAFKKKTKRFLKKNPLSAAISSVTYHLSANMVDGEVATSKAPIPEDSKILTRHVKKLGYLLRADIVSICRLPQFAVFSHDRQGNPIELNHQFAIVVVVDQDYETINGSTGSDWISSTNAFRGYSATALIACTIANYIRRLGYPARAHCAGNYQVAVPPLLLLSGIGEVSRPGIVLNPFLGLRYKAAIVTTDLPLIPDKPIDFGLQEFCRKCKRCAERCPVKAIPFGDKVIYNGYETWRLNVERAAKFGSTNPKGEACATCIKVCPWNKPEGWTRDVVRWMARHTPFLDKLIIKMDDIRGHGKQNIKDKWWFDLEEVDGIMTLH